MFGFSWGEIGIIMAVALIAIGPKDFPVAIRTVTGLMKKARGLASEFQGHVDEMMREANIADVVGDIKKAANLTQGIPGAMARTLDPDGLLKGKAGNFATPDEVEQAQVDAPRFIPPEAARKAPVPAFIPPGTKRWGF
jgi:sec-independent protein translocase protein TatB